MTERPLTDQGSKEASSGGSDISGLARRGLLSLGGAGVSAVASFVLIVVVTRSFGKETAGYLFSATSLFVIAESLCALGTATGMVYFIARLRALGRGDAVRALIGVAVRPVAIASVLAGTGLFLAAPALAEQLGSGGSTAQATQFIRVVAVFLPFATCYDVFIAATQGFHTMTPTVALEKVGRPVIQLGALAVAGAFGLAWLLPYAWAAPYLVALVLVAVWLARLVRHDAAAENATSDRAVTTGAFWRYTAPRGIASAAQLSLQRLDIVLVALYLGPAEAAIYTAATRFVVLGQLGSQAVALAVQPKFAELLAHDDRVSARQVYRTTTAWVMAVTWPVHLVVAVLAPVVLRIFGPGYDSGWSVVVVLALTMLFATSCGMVTMLLVMAGKTTWNLLNVLVALTANLVLNLTLIPVWGIFGSAVAWSVAIALSNALPLFQVRRALGLDPFGRGSVAVAGLATLCFAAVPGLGWLLGGDPVLLVGLTVVGGVLYAVGLWFLRGVLELDGLVGSIAGRLRPRRV
ncbi:polysaccharide biosynthesis C-terminal domain-containing protein [Mumia qirimensis]|uniref:oligosaccharide flippase family protein n=1 Tax=Mumia qirimensis TaxID=3234852 RepID=UPI00351CE1ED